MSNNNDAEKAIITLGKIFKIFAVVVVVLIIALCVYLASHSESKQSTFNPLENSLRVVALSLNP